MTQTVLILGGSGKIGTHTAEAFWNAGWTVRQYKRGTDMAAAAKVVDVIVNGLNPPNYNNWAKNIPLITAQVIAAAKASGATVIIPGNVYNFGDQGGIWDENTPHRPVTEKGQIRMDMEAAYRASGVQTIVLRAGNFIDPNRAADTYSMVTVAKAGKGKITALGKTDVMQAHAFLPDWARAAVKLAEQRHELERFEDIPFPGHAFTLLQVQDVLQGALNRQIKITPFPWWAMTVLVPFWEVIRELRKMRYLSDTDHQLGTDKFNALLPDFKATDLRTVLLAGLPPEVYPDQTMRTSRKTIPAE